MKNLHLFSLSHKKRILETQHLYSIKQAQFKENIYKIIIICNGQIVIFEKNIFF